MASDPQAFLRDLIERQRLQSLAVSSTGFAFDPRSGQSFTINRTGLATLEHLRRTADIDETVSALSTRYGVPADMVLGAVEVFVRQLARYLV
ncbi:MAG: PqqD family protein [Alphaproteobacteria bacterium]|nr:PqqD family protein [Alphaproteobacteria bacterium]MBF0130865.1 PqqD family protein [Alphaproteobacteria bacterium]